MGFLGLTRGTRGGHAAKELRKQANHGNLIMAWGRLWAVILLVFFSVGALITLAGVPLQHIATAIQTDQPVNLVEATTSATILALVIGMDLAMLIASMMIRGMRARGKKINEWWGYLAIVLFVGCIEALTFGVMLVYNEHPNNGVAWVLVVARSIAVPICAVFLSLVTNLPVTPSDVRGKLQIGAGEGVMSYVDMAVQTGEADPAALFDFFSLVNDPAAMEQPGWETRIQQALARLKPDEVKREMERHIAELETKLTDTVAQAKQQVSDAQAAAEERAIEFTSRALTSLLATGNLLQWLVEARPELADITLSKSAVSRRKVANNSGPKMPTTRADALRFFLHNLEITPAKHRGIWIASSDISALNSGANMPETPTELAKILGNNTKEGTAYIAPLDKVMERLLAYHCVPEAIANQWALIEQSSDNSEPISLQSRRDA